MSSDSDQFCLPELHLFNGLSRRKWAFWQWEKKKHKNLCNYSGCLCWVLKSLLSTVHVKHVLQDEASDNLEGGYVVRGIRSELKSRLCNFSGEREEGEVADQICPKWYGGKPEAGMLLPICVGREAIMAEQPREQPRSPRQSHKHHQE